MVRTRWWMASAAAVVLLLAACGEETPEEDEDDVVADSRSLAASLAYLPVPEHDTQIHVQASDFDRVGALLGEEKPDGADTDVDDLITWMARTNQSDNETGTALSLLFPTTLGWDIYASNTEIIAETLGVSLFDVTHFAEVIAPPGGATVVQGGYDTDRITATLGEPQGGVWSIGEEIVQDFEARDGLPPLGAGLRLGEIDDRLLLFRLQAPLEGVLNSRGPTLADEDEIADIAEVLDSAGWYSAMILGSFDLSGSPAEDLALEPFTALGAALDVVDGQEVMHLAYAHDDAATAEENVERIATLVDEGTLIDGRPVSDVLTIIDTDITGTVLLASFEPVDAMPGIVWNMIAQRDTLTTHGG